MSSLADSSTIIPSLLSKITDFLQWLLNLGHICYGGVCGLLWAVCFFGSLPFVGFYLAILAHRELFRLGGVLYDMLVFAIAREVGLVKRQLDSDLIFFLGGLARLRQLLTLGGLHSFARLPFTKFRSIRKPSSLRPFRYLGRTLLHKIPLLSQMAELSESPLLPCLVSIYQFVRPTQKIEPIQQHNFFWTGFPSSAEQSLLQDSCRCWTKNLHGILRLHLTLDLARTSAHQYRTSFFYVEVFRGAIQCTLVACGRNVVS
jgi:hypothetical protein